jgi:hypothetical protein
MYVYIYSQLNVPTYIYICLYMRTHTHNITKIRGLGYPWGALREPMSMALVLSAHPPRMWFRHRSKTTDRPKNTLEDEHANQILFILMLV